MQRWKMVDRSADIDNAGLVGFGMVFGYWITDRAAHVIVALALPHWIAQVALSLFTMVAGAVLLHFVKRELNRRWPAAAKSREKEIADTD